MFLQKPPKIHQCFSRNLLRSSAPLTHQVGAKCLSAVVLDNQNRALSLHALVPRTPVKSPSGRTLPRLSLSFSFPFSLSLSFSLFLALYLSLFLSLSRSLALSLSLSLSLSLFLFALFRRDKGDRNDFHVFFLFLMHFTKRISITKKFSYAHVYLHMTSTCS